MPRKREPARTYFREDEQQWVIRDGNVQKRTGYARGQYREAEDALADYIRGRELPVRRGPADPGELLIGEVLARYVEKKGPGMRSPDTLMYCVQALSPFWAELTCECVTEDNCEDYVAWRAEPRTVVVAKRTVVRIANASTARRELGVLQQALKSAFKSRKLRYPVEVTLPREGKPRDRWLTLSEAAKLLFYAAPHVRRFILISLATGRRETAMLELTNLRVDLDAGIFRFLGEDDVESNKRRGQCPITRKLQNHLRRWRQMDAGVSTHVIHWHGEPIDCIKHGIHRAAERAGLKGVGPHVLKHTAITWAVMGGCQIEEAAEFFHTSPETIRRSYWHHSPYHQAEGLAAVERRGNPVRNTVQGVQQVSQKGAASA